MHAETFSVSGRPIDGRVENSVMHLSYSHTASCRTPVLSSVLN